MKGIWLPRDAYQQEQHSEIVDVTAAVPGDLIFFCDRKGKGGGAGHVGIVIENKESSSGSPKIVYIHSSGPQEYS